MTKKLIATVAFFALASTAQAQQITVQEPLDVQNRLKTGTLTARAEWNALTFYLQGVVEGVGAYQRTLIAQGKPPVFCPKPGKKYSIEELFRHLSQSSQEDKDRPATVVILEGYANAHPCN